MLNEAGEVLRHDPIYPMVAQITRPLPKFGPFLPQVDQKMPANLYQNF